MLTSAARDSCASARQVTAAFTHRLVGCAHTCCCGFTTQSNPAAARVGPEVEHASTSRRAELKTHRTLKLQMMGAAVARRVCLVVLMLTLASINTRAANAELHTVRWYRKYA